MTQADLAKQLEAMPPGTLVPRDWLVEQLRDAGVAAPPVEHAPDPATPASWREKLWTCASETRLGVAELAEALGRPTSWVYRHTSEKSGYDRVPHRRQEGALIFLAGEVRAWLQQHEEAVVKPSAPVVPIGRSRGQQKR